MAVKPCGCGQKVGTEGRPVIAGKQNGAEPVLVRTNRSVGVAAAGREVFATGSLLPVWIDKGWVELVGG